MLIVIGGLIILLTSIVSFYLWASKELMETHEAAAIATPRAIKIALSGFVVGGFIISLHWFI